MKLFKNSWQICLLSFRKWTTNYRIWIAAILLLILTHKYTKDYAVFCANMNIKMSPYIFPFIYSAKYIKILFFAPLLMIFCDAPFVDHSQPYIIYRSGRMSWSIGQIVYIVITSAMYFAFLMLISNLFILKYVDFSISGWGKVFGTLANTDAYMVMGLRSYISGRALAHFTPQQAMVYTFVLSWLSGIFLGLLIYLINSFFESRSLGIFFSAFFLVLDSALTGYHRAMWFSPISWNSIDNISIGNVSQLPPIKYMYAAFAFLILIVVILSIIVNRQQSIHVTQPV